MFCSKCAKALEPSARFCPNCGTSCDVAPFPPVSGVSPRTGQLVRSRSRRMIAGVCAGFSDHYGWDINLVRVVLVVLTLFGAGTPVIAYLAAWIIIPDGQYQLPFMVPVPPPPVAQPVSGNGSASI